MLNQLLQLTTTTSRMKLLLYIVYDFKLFCEFTCVLHKHVTNQLQKITVNQNPTRAFGKS